MVFFIGFLIIFLVYINLLIKYNFKNKLSTVKQAIINSIKELDKLEHIKVRSTLSLKNKIYIINSLTLILSILLFTGVFLIYMLIFYQNKTYIFNIFIVKDFFTLKLLVIFLFLFIVSLSSYLLLLKYYSSSFNFTLYTFILTYLILVFFSPMFLLYSCLFLPFLNRFIRKQRFLHFTVFMFIFIEILYSYKFNIYILNVYDIYFKYYFLITQKFDNFTIANLIYSCNLIFKNSLTISYDLVRNDFEPQKFEILNDFIYNSYYTNIMIKNGNSILVFYNLFELLIITLIISFLILLLISKIFNKKGEFKPYIF